LSVLRLTKTNSDESLRALLRLLIDETVDDLSQSGSRCGRRSVQKPNPSMDAVVVSGEFAGTFRPKRNHKLVGTSRSGKAHEEKKTHQTLLGLRPGHDVDVTVNFLA